MAGRICQAVLLAICLLAVRTAASESAEALRMRGRSPPAPRNGGSGQFSGGGSDSFVGTLGGTSGASSLRLLCRPACSWVTPVSATRVFGAPALGWRLYLLGPAMTEHAKLGRAVCS